MREEEDGSPNRQISRFRAIMSACEVVVFLLAAVVIAPNSHRGRGGSTTGSDIMFICTNISPERRRLDTLDLGSGHHGIILRAVIVVLEALFLQRCCSVSAALLQHVSTYMHAAADLGPIPHVSLKGSKTMWYYLYYNKDMIVRLHVLIIIPYIALNVGLA